MSHAPLFVVLRKLFSSRVQVDKDVGSRGMVPENEFRLKFSFVRDVIRAISVGSSPCKPEFPVNLNNEKTW